MKKFISKILLLLSVMIAFIILLFWVVPENPDAYLMSYKKKCEILERTPSPRLILVGGSNLAFGVDSKILKDSLNINVVNMGVHWGIGLKYMIDDAQTYLRDDDIMVVVPEYDHFFDGNAYGGSCLAYVMCKEYGRKLYLLNSRQICNVGRELLSLLNARYKYIMFKLKGKKQSEDAYAASNFNEYGDESKHWELEGSKKMNLDSLYKFDTEYAEMFVGTFKEIDRDNNIMLLPPVMREAGYLYYKGKIDIVDSFLTQKGVPFYVSTNSNVMPDEYAYDSKYHQNRKGVVEFSKRLVKEIRPFMQECMRE